MPAGARIRPLRADDVPAADLVAYETLPGALPVIGESSEQRQRRGHSRLGHLLDTDPDGAWVAESDEGRIVGIATALLRDGIWGLSLFAVRPDLQGRGIGRALLDAALGYADGARGALILSSSDPRAMRLYALAGFALRPQVAAAGIVHRPALPVRLDGVREGSLEDLELVESVSRAVRGATHARDVPQLLGTGSALCVLDGRGYVVHQAGTVRMLAALDEDAARSLLWTALAQSAPGSSLQVDFISAGQDWAIEVALAARLALSPEGPLFVRGEVGPMRPYLPNGAYL
jgi:ribosomal protein S18 acetylase RimI-like enzyme